MVAVPSLHPSPGFPGVPAIPAFSLSGCVSIVHFKLSAWPHLLSAVPLEHFASLVGHGAGFRSCCIVPRLCRTTCNNPLGDFHGCPDARRPVPCSRASSLVVLTGRTLLAGPASPVHLQGSCLTMPARLSRVTVSSMIAVLRSLHVGVMRVFRIHVDT